MVGGINDQNIRITYGLFGSVDKFDIFNVNQTIKLLRTNTNLYEVLNNDYFDVSNPDRRVGFNRIYGDIDLSCNSNETMDLYDSIIQAELKEFFNNQGVSFCLMTSSGFKKSINNWFSSWRFVICDYYCSLKTMKNLIKNLEKELIPIFNTRIPNFSLDTSIYNKGRKMRMVNSSKDGEDRPLRIIHGNLKDSLITYIPEGCKEFIDNSQDTTEQSAEYKPNSKPSSGLLDDLQWNECKELCSIIDTKHFDDRTTCINIIWKLWGYEQTDRMKNLINQLCAKSSKYQFGTIEGTKWVNSIINSFDIRRFTGVEYVWSLAKQSNPESFQSICKKYPKSYYKELFQQSFSDFTYEEYSERFVKTFSHHFKSFDSIILQSHLGTGKTLQIMGDSKLNIEGIITGFKRVLFISGRKSFTAYALSELKHRGIFFESYENNRKTLSECDKLFIQVESLWRLDNAFQKYELIIFDESETILHQFHSTTTNKEHMIDNHIIFERLISSADKIIASDAFVTDRTLNIFKELRNKDRTIFIKNTFNPYSRVATEIMPSTKDIRVPNTGVWVDKILESIKAKKKIVIVWTSKTKGLAFAKTYLEPLAKEGLKYKFYNGNSTKADREELGDVNKHWAELDVLMYTTSITVGISYNNQSAVFDEIFLYASSASATPRDIAQALLRCRHITDNKLTYVCDLRGYTSSIRGMDNIIKYIKSKKERVQAENPVIVWTKAPVWAEYNYAFNENEIRTSSAEYRRVLHHYLLLSGYSLNNIGGVSTVIFEGDSYIDYEDIQTIDYSQSLEIQSKIYADKADPIDRLILKKYRFLSVLKKDLDSDIYSYVWSKFMNKKKEEAQFWNLVSEKHSNTKEILEKECYERYLGMTKKSVEQRLILDKILKILGIENSQQPVIYDDKNFRIIVDLLKPLENEIRTVFGLRLSRRENNEFLPKHAQDLLNSVFESWSGNSFKSINEKKVQVNKKRERIFDYELSPNILDINSTKLWDIITDKFSIITTDIIEEPKNRIILNNSYEEEVKPKIKDVKTTKLNKPRKVPIKVKPIKHYNFKNKKFNDIPEIIINSIQQKLKFGIKLTVKSFKNKKFNDTPKIINNLIQQKLNYK